jgi:hypothetical protein
MRKMLVAIFIMYTLVVGLSISLQSHYIQAQDQGVGLMSADAVQQPSDYMHAFTSLADKFGLWAAVTVLLIISIVITTWLRERRMANRIDILENKNADNVAVVVQVKDAVTSMTAGNIEMRHSIELSGLKTVEALNETITVMRELKAVIESRDRRP